MWPSHTYPPLDEERGYTPVRQTNYLTPKLFQMALEAVLTPAVRSYEKDGQTIEIHGYTIPCKLEMLVKTKTSTHNNKPYHVVVLGVLTNSNRVEVATAMTWNCTTKWEEEEEYQAFVEADEKGRLKNWKLELPGNRELNVSMFRIAGAEEASEVLTTENFAV